jgi:hypothetical protein
VSRKYIVTIFVDSGDKSEEWAQWNKDHTADLVKLPGFVASRAYRVRNDYLYRHPETFDTQPPYDFMNYYEVDEEGLKTLTTIPRPVGDPPAGGTRPFPTPLGPFVGHAYLWEALADENRAPGQ